MSSDCPPDAIQWIAHVFGDCISTNREIWSFGIGLLSNVIGVFIAIPQIVQNCKTREVEGQSPFLFSLILLGDILSFIGLFFNNAIATQYITFGLYTTMDAIVFIQYLCYKYCCSINKDIDDEKYDEDKVCVEYGSSTMSQSQSDSKENSNSSVAGGIVMAGALVSQVKSITDFHGPYQKDRITGTIFGWVGAIIYTGSRIPQVVKNQKNRKVKDVNPFYFIIAIAGNVSFSISLFVRSTDPTWLWAQAPWICGCFGPMCWDIIQMFQMCIFGVESTQPGDVSKPNLDQDESSSTKDEADLETLA